MSTAQHPTEKIHTIQWRRLFSWLVLALVIGGLLWLGWHGWMAWRAAGKLRDDLGRLQALTESDKPRQGIGETLAVLPALCADMDDFADAAGPFLALTPYLGWLPEIGPTVQSAPHLVECAQHLLRAGETAAEAIGPALKGPDSGLSLSKLTALLAASRDNWPAVQQEIEASRRARERINTARLHPKVQALLTLLDKYLPLLEAGAEGARWAPDLLGAGTPRAYLLLVQNEDELRATGGFISGAARLTLQDGKVVELSFEDSYAVDDLRRPYPPPPQPLRDFMAAEQLLFRDSNWSPDFPTSAEVALTLYAMGKGLEADGVVALDQRAIAMMVGALGTLQVEGWPQPITGKNVLAAAREAWEPKAGITEEWWEHRKDFMAALFRAAMRRLEDEPEQVDWPALAQALWQALRERHLMIYVREAGPAEWLYAQGWDGALRDVPGDYLMVLDTNMGFNKVNAVVQQSLEYLVDLSHPEEPRAYLQVRHTHPMQGWQGVCRQEARYDATYEEMTRRCYWNYLRVLAPRGSELIEGLGHPIPAEALLRGQPYDGKITAYEEDGKQVFAALMLLAPGQTLDTRLVYRLPADILQAGRTDNSRAYSLTIQKQPGTEAVPLRVMMVLPAEAEITAVSPTPAVRGRNTLTFELTLRTDQTLRVEWREAGAEK